jgi:hypothetical protein
MKLSFLPFRAVKDRWSQEMPTDVPRCRLVVKQQPKMEE